MTQPCWLFRILAQWAHPRDCHNHKRWAHPGDCHNHGTLALGRRHTSAQIVTHSLSHLYGSLHLCPCSLVTWNVCVEWLAYACNDNIWWNGRAVLTLTQLSDSWSFSRQAPNPEDGSFLNLLGWKCLCTILFLVVLNWGRLAICLPAFEWRDLSLRAPQAGKRRWMLYSDIAKGVGGGSEYMIYTQSVP